MANRTEPGIALCEASGVVRHGDCLLIVGDGTPGVYFSTPLDGEPGDVVTIDPARVTARPLAGGDVALDLEAIDVLADGRVVALSEQLRALIGKDGLIADYPDRFGGFAGKGLEGLAIRPNEDHPRGSVVAALWEGGYPEKKHAPPDIWPLVKKHYLAPAVVLHTLPPGGKGWRFKGEDPQPYDLVTLAPPAPSRHSDEPAGYRASDLVWHRVKHRGDEHWGFIVLLNGEGGSDQVVLQRFAKDGTAVGDPLDLTETLPAELRRLKWEGLGWFEPGRRLVLVHDSKAGSALTAAIVRCPKDW